MVACVSNGPVCLIVPCVWHQELEAVLVSFLRQAHDDMHCICVTETGSERAAEVVCELQRTFPRCIHVVAGRGRQCGQKNWNVLAGIAHARALTPAMIVCCDDDNYAPDAHWLAGFLAECALRPGYACYTTFRTSMPRGPENLAHVVYDFATTFQHVGLYVWPRMVWGGALAFRLDTFDRLEIAELWGRTVVDDMTLTARLRSARERARYIAGADLVDTTRLPSLPRALGWVRRQLQYLWFYVPQAYVATLLVSLGFAFVVAWMLVSFPIWFGLYMMGGPCVVRGVSVLGTAWCGRLLQVVAVLLCLPAIIILLTCVVVSCMWTPYLKWKQRTYRIGRRGDVIEIRPTVT